MTTNTKRCPGCGLDLPRDAFPKNACRKDGLSSRCKVCEAKRLAELRRSRKDDVHDVHPAGHDVHDVHPAGYDVHDVQALTKLRMIATSQSFGPKLTTFLTTLLSEKVINAETVLKAIEVTFPSVPSVPQRTPATIQTAPAVPEEAPEGDGGASITAALRQLELLGAWPETTRKPTRGEVEELAWN